MPTNANTFNSRVTSEALEAKFRQVFPAQGGAELVQDLFASGVIQPVVDFSTVAEGSVLPVNLQTAWDFSTGFNRLNTGGTTSVNIITNPGFWLIDLNAYVQNDGSAGDSAQITVSDGFSTKTVYQLYGDYGGTGNALPQNENKFVVFARSGDTITASLTGSATMTVWYRQIADVNGTLVNPLGFTFT